MEKMYSPSLSSIRLAFNQALKDSGARIQDMLEDRQRLITRAILPGTIQLKAGDRIQGGVALKVGGPKIVVQPYIFRQLCRNGAIIAASVEQHLLERWEEDAFMPSHEEERVLADVGAFVQHCAEGGYYEEAARRLRLSLETSADHNLMIISLLARVPKHWQARLVDTILARIDADKDSSAFGLINAVTSVARDTRDPETRWQIEEAGGEMMMCVQTTPRGPVDFEPGNEAEIPCSAADVA